MNLRQSVSMFNPYERVSRRDKKLYTTLLLTKDDGWNVQRARYRNVAAKTGTTATRDGGAGSTAALGASFTADTTELTGCHTNLSHAFAAALTRLTDPFT